MRAAGRLSHAVVQPASAGVVARRNGATALTARADVAPWDRVGSASGITAGSPQIEESADAGGNAAREVNEILGLMGAAITAMSERERRLARLSKSLAVAERGETLDTVVIGLMRDLREIVAETSALRVFLETSRSRLEAL